MIITFLELSSLFLKKHIFPISLKLWLINNTISCIWPMGQSRWSSTLWIQSSATKACKTNNWRCWYRCGWDWGPVGWLYLYIWGGAIKRCCIRRVIPSGWKIFILQLVFKRLWALVSYLSLYKWDLRLQIPLLPPRLYGGDLGFF
jgi:hypothetical protein